MCHLLHISMDYDQISAGQQQICSHFLWNRSKWGRPRFAIYIYWIPKMHKNPSKHQFISGSAKWSPSLYPFFLQSRLHILSNVFRSTAKQPILEVGWIRCGSSKIQRSYWNILNLRISNIASMKSFDFSTLYTTIPHYKPKSRVASIIHNSIIFKDGNGRYKYLVFGHEEEYFVKEHSDSKNKNSEDDIIKILEFLVDNIFVVCAGKVFQQIVGIPMGTNCAPLLADIFLYSYEAEFIQSLLSAGRNLRVRVSVQFHIQTCTSMIPCPYFNNPEFESYLGQMYPVEL